LNWTCSGGYIQLLKALWETYNTECGSTSEYYFRNAKPNLQNKCNNKTTCDFTATDSSLNVSCESLKPDSKEKYLQVAQSNSLNDYFSQFASSKICSAI
jgi:hypothetical protein